MSQRYVRVPWLCIEQTDLAPQGDPETAVFLSSSTLVGLHIKGVEGQVMLGIREDVTGQPMTCAITNEIAIDTMHVQSNPRRAVDDGPKDWGEQ